MQDEKDTEELAKWFNKTLKKKEIHTHDFIDVLRATCEGCRFTYGSVECLGCEHHGFPDHIMSPQCPCGPKLVYKDPVTGNEVWVHNKEN